MLLCRLRSGQNGGAAHRALGSQAKQQNGLGRAQIARTGMRRDFTFAKHQALVIASTATDYPVDN